MQEKDHETREISQVSNRSILLHYKEMHAVHTFLITDSC